MIGFVLMGDIVESGKKDSIQLMTDFKRLLNTVKKKDDKRFLSPITITLGDEFQSIVKSLADSLNIIIEIEEERIRQKCNFKLRFVINEGKIDTKINSKIAYEMLGTGLTFARELLDEVKLFKEKRVLINLYNGELASLLTDQFFLLTSITDQWKYKDYQIIEAFINLKDYYLVAKATGKDRSLMWRREKTLQIAQYFAVKNSIQQIPKI